jgi:hypothetical protein
MRKIVMNLLIKSFLILVTISLMMFVFVQTTNMENGLTDDLTSNDDAAEEDEQEEDRVLIVDGYKAIQLDEETITTAGLEFSEMESISVKPEFNAYAEIIDVEPIVTLKTEYESILAQQRVLSSDLINHNKILQRAEALHKAKSLSTRDLEKNRADRDLKSSQLSAINTRLNNVKYKIKSLWGDELASYILEKDKFPELDALMSYKTLLVLLSLPKDRALDQYQQKVFVSDINERDSSIVASYLDKANRVSNPIYGESYIYSVSTERFRVGMRLFAWIEDNNNTAEGYFIPDSAVIWYANKSWMYLKHGENLFVRKPLVNARKIKHGWLLKDKKLVTNDLIVTRGGQTLLSEEFKWAIPDEEDD